MIDDTIKTAIAMNEAEDYDGDVVGDDDIDEDDDDMDEGDDMGARDDMDEGEW